MAWVKPSIRAGRPPRGSGVLNGRLHRLRGLPGEGGLPERYTALRGRPQSTHLPGHALGPPVTLPLVLDGSGVHDLAVRKLYPPYLGGVKGKVKGKQKCWEDSGAQRESSADIRRGTGGELSGRWMSCEPSAGRASNECRRGPWTGSSSGPLIRLWWPRSRPSAARRTGPPGCGSARPSRGRRRLRPRS